MFCQHCGAVIEDAANFCTSCGSPVAESTQTATVPPTSGTWKEPQPQDTVQDAAQQQIYQQPAPQYSDYQQPSGVQDVETVYAHTQQTTTLALIAFVLALISTVSIGWLLIPLAWMIPMTVRTWGIYKGKKPNTTAFGVCTLIFVNLIGGILLLVADKDR